MCANIHKLHAELGKFFHVTSHSWLLPYRGTHGVRVQMGFQSGTISIHCKLEYSTVWYV